MRPCTRYKEIGEVFLDADFKKQHGADNMEGRLSLIRKAIYEKQEEIIFYF